MSIQIHTHTHTHTHRNKAKSILGQAKQNKNKQVGEQAKDLIFHRSRVNNLLHTVNS